MIRFKIFDWLYKNKKNKPKGNLLPAFSFKGHQYYIFPDRVSMPINRLLKISEYARWISRSLDKDNLLELINIADELLYKGLANNKNAAKIGYILTEIKERESKAVPIEVYFNYFAAIYIRDDENINEFNNDIHMSKVEAFKEASTIENSFFFHLKEFKNIMNSSNISSELLKSFLKESRMESEKIKKMKTTLEQIM